MNNTLPPIKSINSNTAPILLSRMGVYGIIQKKNAFLLVEQQRGPYKGKRDLPGGKIEFGEAPEQTLQRELQEELQGVFSSLKWWAPVSILHTYFISDQSYQLHQIGLIYIVRRLAIDPSLSSEQVLPFSWLSLKDLREELLSPIAWKVLKQL